MTALPSPALTAEEITRASGSNLALAFFVLPRERRRDISVFYAFCRVVDDIADAPLQSPGERAEGLARWRSRVKAPEPGEPPLAAAVRGIIQKYRLPVALFHDLIAGCEMDLSPVQYETWDDLRVYCHRVASVVGLVSIEIFGYRNPGCRRYAESLGLALQVTNILRDVAEDHANDGRIYIPREEMMRYGYTPDDLARGVYNEAFTGLMRHQAARARALYAEAVAALPPEDARAMRAAEMMRAIYSRILDRMEADGFRVFTRRYRLNRFQKLVVVARTLLLGAG